MEFCFCGCALIFKLNKAKYPLRFVVWRLVEPSWCWLAISCDNRPYWLSSEMGRKPRSVHRLTPRSPSNERKWVSHFYIPQESKHTEPGFECGLQTVSLSRHFICICMYSNAVQMWNSTLGEDTFASSNLAKCRYGRTDGHTSWDNPGILAWGALGKP